MSLKAELDTWAEALKAYDAEDFEKALDQFGRIADSSKILTNMGLICATLGEHEAAVEHFNAATSLDQYLAVAYFQCGVSNFLLTRYEMSQKDFEEALLYLRGNQAINYEQLGLKFKLYSAEVLFNLGLSKIYIGRQDEGMRDLHEAIQEKATEEHNVIDEAIQDRGDGYTVFSIPVGVLYRPSESKLKNARTKDYLGKAKLVAAADERDAYTTFTGVTRLQQGMTPSGAPLDQPVPDSNDRPLARSASAFTPSEALPKPAALSRNATTINVVTPARDQPEDKAPPPKGGMARTRSITGTQGPSRGLSVRTGRRSPSVNRSPSARSAGRGGPSPGPGPASTSKREEDPSQKANNASRLTEIYDDYIDKYAEEVPEVPPLPMDGKSRVAAWARNNANPPMRRPAAPSVYSTFSGGGSVRRKVSRRPTYRSAGTAERQTIYDDEEEGYVSGDYEDVFELIKIRVKLHYRDDVRGMTITADMPFEDFMGRVTQKFRRPADGLELKFKDEEGTRVSLRDDSDYDLAIETARENARGKPEGKLEIWCSDS